MTVNLETDIFIFDFCFLTIMYSNIYSQSNNSISSNLSDLNNSFNVFY